MSSRSCSRRRPYERTIVRRGSPSEGGMLKTGRHKLSDMRRRAGLPLLLLLVAIGSVGATGGATLPKIAGAVRFAVIGDTGTGDSHQYEIASQLVASRRVF